MRRRDGQRGFTLLEMMIALAIVAMMMFITWSVTAQIGGDKKAIAKIADRNHELRVAMTRMVHDISMAYLSQNETADVLEPRTIFKGGRGGDALLRFSSFAHQVMWADANESEQTMISYFTAPDPFEHGTTNLLRRETRRMTDEGYDAERITVKVKGRDNNVVSYTTQARIMMEERLQFFTN